MEFKDYLSKVADHFAHRNEITLGRFTATQFYEEKFEIKWLASKLKMYSFLSYLPQITKPDIVEFSKECLSRALTVYKGIPRGLQSGVGSFGVLASENIDAEAIAYAKARPPKHWAAFEMPIIYDLAKNSLYYYEKTPLWGAMYAKFIREYTKANFS
ncbi:MAG: hypothetical protein FWF98_04430 [Dehalococcoidia bacterium]|nr:hypothetical protein [Dehalococcoidia bacterium]